MLGEIAAKTIIGEALKKVGKLGYEYFFPEEQYLSRLQKVIDESITEFREKKTYDTTGGRFAFFDSQEIIIQLSKHVLFREPERPDFTHEIKNYPLLIPPQEDEVLAFHTLFLNKVNSDDALRKLFIEENYKAEIYAISEKNDRILKEVQGLGNNDAEINMLYMQQLKEIDEYIEDYKPKTAIARLTNLSNLPIEERRLSVEVKAKLLCLKGKCLINLQKLDEGAKEFIKAERILSTDIEIKERAAWGYLHLKEFVRAEQLADESISMDPLSLRGWSVKISCTANLDETIRVVPKSVKREKDFAVFLAARLISSKEHVTDEVMMKYGIDLNIQELPSSIKYTERSFWLFYSTYRLQEVIGDIRFIDFRAVSTAISKDERLISVKKLFEAIYNSIKNTEIFDYYLHHVLYYYYVRFLISQEEVDALRMLEIIGQINNKGNYLIQVVQALSITRNEPKAIKLIESYGVDKNIVLSKALAELYDSLGDKTNAKYYFNQYINSIEIVDGLTCMDVMKYLEYFCASPEEQKDVWAIVTKKQFTSDYIKQIIECFILRYEKVYETEIVDKLTAIFSDLQDKDYHLRIPLINILMNVGAYTKVIELLKPTIDISDETAELYFYVFASHLSKTNTKELQLVLKHWRNHFTPNVKFLSIEIDLYSLVPNWEEVEAVSKKGMEKFPEEEGFLFHLIASLHHQRKKTEIINLSPQILERVSRQDIAFRIAGIIIANDCFDCALELLYRFAIDKENKKARSSYFATSVCFPSTYFKSLTKITEDTTAEVIIREKTVIVPITSSSIKNNPLAKQLKGKNLGEEFLYEEFDGKYEKVVINRIMNKYAALLNDINREAGDVTGLDLKALDFETVDIETINKRFVEEHGASGSMERDRVSKEIKSYHTGEISFSELTNSVFKRDFKAAYYHLTNNSNEGIRIVPAILNHIKSFEDKQLVLDATSLLLFYELHNAIGLPIKHKFLISQLLRKQWADDLLEIKYLPASTMSLSITMEGVIPHFYPENFKEKQIAELERLLSWVDKYCELAVVEDKLELILQVDDKEKIGDDYLQTLFDNLFLINSDKPDNILISDDRYYYRIYGQNAPISSTENFLRSNYPDIFEEEILPYLLRSNYLGLTLTSSSLLKSFEQTFGLSDSNFNKCLNNLPWVVNPNPYTFPQCVKFIKELYLKPTLGDDHKHRISQSVFIHTMKGFPVNHSTYKLMKKLIRQEFDLLGNYSNSVIDDLNSALEVLGYIE